MSRWRDAAAERAARHPRHVALSVAIAGLLLGGRVPAWLCAAAAFAVGLGSLTIPVVRRPATALALVALLLGAAWAGQLRTAALDATHLAADFGRTTIGDATIVAPARGDAYGGARALVRWRDEPVLLRIPSWWIARHGSALPRVGDIVAVRGRLRPPDLAGQAVHAHAVLRATDLAPTGRRRGGLLGAVDQVRRRAERVLRGRLPIAESALLRGMVLGDDADMPADLRDAFTAASLSHLTAASGQNIMLLAALAFGLCAVAGVGIRVRWALVLVLIIMYVPLAGGGPSIQRAGVMGAATIAAALAGRPASRWYALLLAAAVTLALDPRSAGEAGWQLSFAAVIGIALMAAPARERLRARGLPAAAAEAIAVTAAATLATAPLIAATFGRASLVGLPANVLAAPAVAPIMWLGMAAAALAQVSPVLAEPLVALTGPLLGYLAGLARLVAGLPGAQLPLPLVPLTILCTLAAILITAPRATADGAEPPSLRAGAARWRERGRRRRALMAAAVVVAVLAAVGPALVPPRAVAPPPEGAFRVTALDVGQGDATLLQAGGHAVLVDAGPAGAGIVGALRQAGVRRLDALVVTHPQADHDGGAPAVLAAVPVGLLLDGRGGDRSATSVAIDGPLRRRRSSVVAARAGQVVHAGPLTLRILWPSVGPVAPGTDPNDRAIVARADAYGATALLTADAESNILGALDLAPVDVLKVSHHGSADDGLPTLLQRLRPRIALIEVGAHNTYGHPTPATLQALRAAVPVVRRTDEDGTVRVDLRGGRATLASAR
ncbi:MAG TPA: ComEC/Rec2 family competence protein [Baekduia sp.]|nr:ComEC/Rec2 family competence protein [Baekduia sp.]